MEFDPKTIAAIVAVLYAVYALFKDKFPSLPSLDSIKGFFTKDPEKKEDGCKLTVLQRLWDIRSEFKKEDPIYKNITEAIENLVHYKEVKDE
jgi:hypothetical protein